MTVETPILNAPAVALNVPAAAKINLYLHITGQRPDGYHFLDSLVAFAGVHDTVTLSPAPDLTLSLELDGPYAGDLPEVGGNLALQAAEWLRQAAGCDAGAAIRLEKKLPVASGIGGGSADAAAVLGGMVRLWGLDAAEINLPDIALDLGADVPVSLFGEAAFVGGIGEEIVRAPALPPAWLVLVNPGVALSTPAVFEARDGLFSKPGRFDDSPATAAVLAEFLARTGNDLTAAAIGIEPVIGDVLKALEAAEEVLLARMSGSGATCFGLFAETAAAARAAAEISRAQPGWWVRATPLLADARTPVGYAGAG